MKTLFKTKYMSVNSHLKNSARSAQGLLRSIGIVTLFLLIGSGSAWGEYSTAPAGTYNLVTDASTLTAGDIIIIAGTNSGTTKAISTTQNTNNRASVEVTLSSNSITLAADNTVQGITLEAGTTSETFSFNTGDGYLYAASSSSNYLRTEEEKSANSSWTISISSGLATITAQGSNTRCLMRYNHSSNPPIYACYATTSTIGVLVNIYKKAASGYTVTIAKNNDSYGNVSAASVTGVTSGTSISASGSVLSVGATNVTATPNSGYKFTGWTGIPGGGTVTGNVTVTANFAAATYSNYRTLCSTTDPSLSVSPASLNELDYIVGSGPSAAKSFSMSGTNLTSGTLTITAPTNFQVSKASGSGWASSITFTDVSGTLAATTVYVRLASGKSAGEYSGNVAISGCGLASAVNVAVSGTVYTPTIIATPASVSWSTSVGVAPTTQSVTITGTHLKGDISAALGGTDASSFSINVNTIAQATAEGAGGTITITYTGSYAATTTKTANIQLTASDATTVNVPITFNVIVDPNRYVLTSFAEIGPKDKVIIVGDNGTKYAMSNNNGTTNPPSAIDVTDYIIEAGAALSIADASTMLWNIVKAGDGSFKIKKQSDNTVWLYCTSSNNGVRVGTSAENDFVIVNDGDADGYIRNTYRDALIGVYQSEDWRRYEYGAGHSIGTNIAGQTFSFYVQKSTDPFVTLTSSFSEFTYEYNHGPSTPQSFTVSGANLAANLVVTAPTNYEVCKTSDGSYTSSVSFTPSTGTVSEQTVYIRLAAGLAVGDYDYAQSGGLSVTSTGADAVKAALEGSVTPESFTVTATSSNVSHGTVSPVSQSTTTNMTITASPVDGYRVVNGAGGYTVTAGTASVTNNGDNTFTVTPSTDCTVQINFEAIPTHKVTYWASGVKVQESDVLEGAAIPDQTTKTWSQLADYCATRTACVGWCTNPDYSSDDTAPTGMITTQSPGGTMSASDVNYYAVFANVGGTSNTFSRVTSLSQLADGDVIAIVAEQSGGQIFGTGADHKGGSAPSETDGKITVSAATNKWTLEASSTSWKLLKDNDNKLCADLGYTAYGNTFNIVDANTANYFFIKSSSKALEYYSSNWQFYTISDPANATQNGNVRLKLYKNDPGYIQYATNCACPGYSMHFGTRGESDRSDKDSYCFVASEDADGNSGVYWYLEDFELPAKPHFYVGWEGLWNTTDAKSADADFSDLCFGLVRDNQFSCGYKTLGTYSSGNNQGAIGTLRVRSSYTDNNKYIDFIPGGYILRLSDDNGSSYTSTEFVPASASLTETVWTTDGITTISADLASSGKFFVDLKTSSDHVWAPNMSQVTNISSMGYKKDGGSGSGSWGTGLSSGMRGKFRIWADNCEKNWNCHFVPYYHLSYDGNGAGATNLPEASADKSCEGDNSARTVQVSTTVPTREGYTFTGWKDGGGTSYAAGADVVLSSDVVLYAQWTQNYSITYNRVGGTDVCADETCGAGMTYTVCGTEPTKSGYIFSGWLSNEATPQTYAAGATFTMPADNVTLTAQWTANWHNLTFNVPTGGGSISGGPSGNHVLDNHTFTFPNITGKSDSKWCWTFLGWTETAPNGSGTWATTPSYIAGGATSSAITSDKTYYAVYSKTGAGASGTVELTSSDISRLYTENVSGTENISYGTSHSVTATDGSVWTTTGQQTNGNKTIIQITNASGVWLQLPTVGGDYNSITISHNTNSSARSIAYRTAADGSDVASAATAASSSGPTTITISSGGTTGGYIVNTSGYQYQISGITASYGPPTEYAHTLDDCPCVVTEFDLTYNANTTYFPGSTTSCAGVTNYAFADHDDKYTICSTEPTLAGYKFTGWTTNANGSGDHYDAGDEISCVPDADVTLYAQYERVYTVTFDNQGVTTPVTQASAGAAIDVPSATTPCDAEWAFVGWSETAIAPMSFLPALEITAGTDTYTPTADKTLYAIYRKTSESSAFVAGMSGAYKIKATYNDATDYYATDYNGAKLRYSSTIGDAGIYYIKYVAADGGKYSIQQSDGQYIKYQGKPATSGAHTDLALSATEYFWSISASGSLWSVQATTSTDGNTHYLQFDPSGSTGFKGYTNGIDIELVAAEGQYYYRTMSCEEDFDIIFHNNGTTINWTTGYPEASYKNLADATVVSTFPTATFDGWTFLGWRTADYEESTTAPSVSGIYSTGGNTLTISSTDVNLYPVFTRFEDNPPFDDINGGDYYIYFIKSGSDDGYGGEQRVYAKDYVDKKRYYSTVLCSEATEFTFTKLENGHWTIKDKKTGNYLYGEGSDEIKQRASATDSEWTLTVSSGNQFDAYYVGNDYGQLIAQGDGTSATFMNYRRTNVSTDPDSYHRVYLGGCTNRTFTTNPSTIPNIEIHGQVKVTSTAGKSIKSTSVLTVTASNIATANLTVTSDNSAFKFSLTSNGTYTASVNIPVVSNNVGVTPIYVEYTPTATTDGIEDATVTVSDGDVTPTEVSTELGDVQGRHLLANFVIAAKWGGNWYALPANCTTSSSSTAGIPIIVDNVSDPTSATALSTTKYGLQTVRPGRKADYGTRLVFTEQLTSDVADEQKTLYNGSKTSIQVNAAYLSYATTNPERYEWVPTSSDLKDYLLTSAATLTGDDAETGEKPRTISINNSGVFGTLMQDKAYEGKVRLLPATFVEPAEMQVVEWKANSVVIMYLGNATTATTTVGSNPSSGTQTLASQEMMHGVYELTTNEALTSNAGKTLIITMSDATQKLVVVPMIVSGATTASEDVANDVVVLNGGTLTAATTKHTFKNVTVYGGGKLSIPSGTSLGVHSLTLRAGRLTTNGTGGSVAYSYDYPQVALTGTLTNTAAKINLDYITDYDHWYHLTLPFAAKLKDITRPQEFYGNAVAANNNGSWEIDLYDGAIRATGVYNSWQDIEGADYLGASGDDRALTAGHGYMMWAAPLKVQKTGEATKTRQTYGIHRFVMDVTAADAKTAEMTDKIVDVYAHPAEKNNDYGWNLVGNPYMANLSELASTTLKVGELVKEMKDDKWTGKWIWSETSQTENYRYVTVPANDFSSYEAMKVTGTSVSLSPFKVFFIQVDGETANQEKSLVFDHTKRAASIQSHLKLINEEVETGMIMQHTNFADEKLGFLLSDVYSDAYEKQADYPKMMNPTNYNLYGIHEVGELSFVATSPAIASTSMAIGYQVPEAGDYTLRFDEDSYDRTEVKNLYVTDYGVEPNITTDLMENDYIFHVNQAETNNTRFVVSIVLTPKEPEEPGVETNLEAVDTYQDQPVKFIYQDKMYILHRGVIYDATGKKVRQINK